MRREILTNDEVEAEIARLTKSEAVKLAKKEQRLRFKRRQYLYTLRAYEKRGDQLMAEGVTLEALDLMYANIDGEESEE